MATLPRLPVDLERDVFELLALEYRRDGVYDHLANLLLVAHRIHVWIEPILYGIAIHAPYAGRSPRYTNPPIHTIGQKKYQPEPLNLSGVNGWGKHTRHVLLQNPNPQTIATILDACPNLENFALWASNTDAYQALYNTLGWIPLQKLYINLDELSRTDGARYLERNPILFSHLTHLTLDRATSNTIEDRDLWMGLHNNCPKLTHLGIDDPGIDSIRQVLDMLPNLKILLVMTSYHARPSTAPLDDLDRIRDRRLVFLYVDGFYSELFGDWERGAAGGDDAWVKAERVAESGQTLEEQLRKAWKDEKVMPSEEE